jgi:hypothetical protein
MIWTLVSAQVKRDRVMSWHTAGAVAVVQRVEGCHPNGPQLVTDQQQCQNLCSIRATPDVLTCDNMGGQAVLPRMGRNFCPGGSKEHL